MNVKVKICGIRTMEAAKAAVEEGADFLGFNFVPSSKRYIPPKKAKAIIDKVGSSVNTVGIFKNADVKTVNQIAGQFNLDFVQLHGNEDSEYIKQINTDVIQTIKSVEEVKINSASYFLLDRVKQGKGKMVDADKAKEFAKNYQIFLAGGLTPKNVAVIVKRVTPFAVDVASGVETNGLGDVKKIKAFIRNAKGAYR